MPIIRRMKISSVGLLALLVAATHGFKLVSSSTPKWAVASHAHFNHLARLSPCTITMSDESSASDGDTDDAIAENNNEVESSGELDPPPSSAPPLTLLDKASDLIIALFGVYIVLTVTGAINPYGLKQ